MHALGAGGGVGVEEEPLYTRSVVVPSVRFRRRPPWFAARTRAGAARACRRTRGARRGRRA